MHVWISLMGTSYSSILLSYFSGSLTHFSAKSEDILNHAEEKYRFFLYYTTTALTPFQPHYPGLGQLNSCCATKHCSNLQNFFLFSYEGPKVRKYTKYDRLNFGEIHLQWCTRQLELEQHDIQYTWYCPTDSTMKHLNNLKAIRWKAGC